MRSTFLCALLMVALTACDASFTPNDKVATYDPVSGTIIPAHPCPDWSQTQSPNYENEVHSNFGCSVTNNNALQLAYPHDLVEGHGSPGPDNAITTHVIEQYRAGTLPAPLVPLQPTSSGSSSP